MEPKSLAVCFNEEDMLIIRQFDLFAKSRVVFRMCSLP